MKYTLIILSFILSIVAMTPVENRKKNKKQTVDSLLLEIGEWRNIGPFRGGRSTASTGITGNDQIYYMGTTGGGVWKTEDAGTTWFNISDGYFETGSVGAVAISESDNNIVVVGMGESPVRGVMTSSVRYEDGTVKKDIKFKKVENDINSEKCVVIED